MGWIRKQFYGAKRLLGSEQQNIQVLPKPDKKPRLGLPDICGPDDWDRILPELEDQHWTFSGTCLWTGYTGYCGQVVVDNLPENGPTGYTGCVTLGHTGYTGYTGYQ